jgi:hypothetical protein
MGNIEFAEIIKLSSKAMPSLYMKKATALKALWLFIIFDY